MINVRCLISSIIHIHVTNLCPRAAAPLSAVAARRRAGKKTYLPEKQDPLKAEDVGQGSYYSVNPVQSRTDEEGGAGHDSDPDPGLRTRGARSRSPSLSNEVQEPIRRDSLDGCLGGLESDSQLTSAGSDNERCVCVCVHEVPSKL